MSSWRSSVEDNLKNVMSSVKYQSRDITIKDAVVALNEFRGLKPKVDSFTFNNGTKKSLVVLRGTIPVRFKSRCYNIPMSIWLLDTHPVHAPMVFVSPTSDMSIKQNRHVDTSGVVYLPYLHQWNVKSNLLELIKTCAIIFGEQCPVFAKAPQSHPSVHPNPPSVVEDSNVWRSNSASSSPLPYPVRPSASSILMPSAETTTSPSPQIVSSNASAAAAVSTSNLSDQQVKASLISAVEDKIRRCLSEEYNLKMAEMESLNKIKVELQVKENKMKSMLSSMERECESLDQCLLSMNSKMEEMERQSNDLEKRNTTEINVDEIIGVEGPLYNQLFNAYAQDCAIDDAIYYLGEGLRQSVVDCETFLKSVRNASRKQFFHRLTMQKCRIKANL